MTYGELKVLCLQKVFAIEGSKVVLDDNTRAFLNALPGAANEALALLATAGKPLIRRLDIPVFPQSGKDTAIFRNLKELDRDFFRLVPGEIYFSQTGGFDRLRQPKGFRLEGDAGIWLDSSKCGIWTIYYHVYPNWIDEYTNDDEVISLPPEAARLIPLYVASQLYKDDDLAIATQYRNEFEVGRASLASLYSDDNGQEFESISGWI